MSSPQFLATIYKIWMLRYVDVPEDVGLTLAKEYAAATKPAKRSAKKALPKHIPVVATSNNRSTRTTLVPAGAGRYRLQVNATLRKAARADVGEIIGVSLKIDLASRDLPVPPELEAALKSRPRLKKEFDRLTAAGRMQFLRWFSAKSPEVRKKRLPRALEVLTSAPSSENQNPPRNNPRTARTARVATTPPSSSWAFLSASLSLSLLAAIFNPPRPWKHPASTASN